MMSIEIKCQQRIFTAWAKSGSNKIKWLWGCKYILRICENLDLCTRSNTHLLWKLGIIFFCFLNSKSIIYYLFLNYTLVTTFPHFYTVNGHIGYIAMDSLGWIMYQWFWYVLLTIPNRDTTQFSFAMANLVWLRRLNYYYYLFASMHGARDSHWHNRKTNIPMLLDTLRRESKIPMWIYGPHFFLGNHLV